MDEPVPKIAVIVWLVAFLLVVVTSDDQGLRSAVVECISYSIVGAAFGLAADRIARTLTERLPTEDEVAEGASLRRFRLVTTLIYAAVLVLMALSMWAISDPGIDAGRDDGAGTLMLFVTFMLVQVGLGWRWSQLGRHPMAARPDGPA